MGDDSDELQGNNEPSRPSIIHRYIFYFLFGKLLNQKTNEFNYTYIDQDFFQGCGGSICPLNFGSYPLENFVFCMSINSSV